MTTKLIDDMNLNCAVKLLRYDDVPTTSNNEAVVSALSNNDGISNQPIAEVKRSSRISRKRTKPRIEDGNQSENVKKKKCMIKKSQLNKTESGKTDTPLKEPKKNKIQGSSVKPYDDFSEISDTMTCPISFVDDDNDDDEEITPKKGSSKPKFKISKSIIAVKKKPIILDTNNDNSINKVTKTDVSAIPLKSPKTKTLKSITSNRKKPVLSNVSKNNSSSELEESNYGISTKAPKNKTPKSNTSNKKKSTTNNINDVDKLHELQVNKVQLSNNFVTPEVSKSKTSKSIVSNKKKPVVNTINKNGTTNDHETSNKIEIPKKRARTSLKKEKCQKPDFENKFNNEDNLEQTLNSSKTCMELYTDKELNLSQKFEDDTMMLGSTDNPPKIKKKWSDEWSGGKLVKNISKSNNEELSNYSTPDVNNCKTVKRIPKTQKSKNSNSKKVKTKMLDQLIPEDSPLVYTPITDSNNMDRSLNFPVVQNDGISITFNIPLEESIPAVCNSAVSNPVYNTLSSETLSNNISMIPITVTENSFSSQNFQQSHLSTLEPVSDSDYLSVSTISPENNEMSYGMAILSEAISRQCRESANQQIKNKSPEPDTIDIQSCTKKANNISRPQVPSAMVSPQRVVNNMSKKVLKYSPELCLQSVENELESHSEYEIQLLSKRFNIPISSLRRTVVDEPLSVFRKKYSKSVTPSMVTISPIVKDADSKSGLNLYNYVSGNVDIEYKLEPIREGAAYETNNLKDLMLELSKTMPSWSLSIVTNPPRYVISQMSIGKYGVPSANKCIVLDRTFRASVYINQSLEHKLCKRYTTSTEIVNLIKELNSI